jgi:hypothetical protein
MPWLKLPKKDAHSGDTRRGGATILRSDGLRMGKPTPFHSGGRQRQTVSARRLITMVTGTRGTETSKYPMEYKSNEITSVAESEMVIA